MSVSCRKAAGLVLGLALMAMVMAAPPAGAQSCAGAGTQADLNECTARALQQASAALEERVATILARLDDAPRTAELLLAAQGRWEAYRDAECDFATVGVAGGSIYPTVLAECRTDLTEAREAALAAYLECQEGDLSCPVPPR